MCFSKKIYIFASDIKPNDIMKVKVINKSNNPLPKYATPLSAGMDLRAFITEPIILKPLDRALIPTGLY